MGILEEFKIWYASEPNALMYCIVGGIILLFLLNFMFKGKSSSLDQSVTRRIFQKGKE